MIIRTVSAVVACIATVAFGSSAAAQDTTRTRDSMQMHMQMQMQRQAVPMTAQSRDRIITQLLDSASREQDATVAQRLRDSVSTLRLIVIGVDTMSNRMTMQPAIPTQQQQQMADPMQQSQPTATTSDQRFRIQKDGRP